MNANDLLSAVLQLDLEPIKAKLMHAASGEAWNRVRANAVEREYRRFLCVMKLHPDELIAPMVDVDTFWHYHILDTMKYAADCAAAFGYFVHHDPAAGIDDVTGEQARAEGGERMRLLYESVFAERYPGTVDEARASAQGQAKHARKNPGIRVRRERTGSATAYCAGPHIKASARQHGTRAHAEHMQSAATAYCPGPRGALRTRAPAAAARAPSQAARRA